ncbi:uncharacterized protein LOC9654435 [Selaginella moellendorffii]|uniref:uncharacterized protein LOC9654435 n=1 Tax=Selaginella moellendorffii TaxID=88036 RepID=UPI000D1C6BB5|nr:uncharacterized protein LOC9654435 [Selaginella moellendorffii]|eukprot:XP_024524542.1 uncharacterized protein LOC9654435 [Selaginella moellendorffii]
MTCVDSLDSREEERSLRGKNSGSNAGTLDELNFSHIFDYNAIEQIANGLEKMVQSWSTAQEERAQEYVRVSVSLEDDDSSTKKIPEALDLNSLKNIDEYVEVAPPPMSASATTATIKPSSKNFSRISPAEKKLSSSTAKASSWEKEKSDFVPLSDRKVSPQPPKAAPSPGQRFGAGITNRISGGFQKPASPFEKENSSARPDFLSSIRGVNKQKVVEQENGRYTPRKSSPEVATSTASSPTRPEAGPRRNFQCQLHRDASNSPNRVEMSPRRNFPSQLHREVSTASSSPNRSEVSPRRNFASQLHREASTARSSPSRCEVRDFPSPLHREVSTGSISPNRSEVISPRRNFPCQLHREVSPRRNLSCQVHGREPSPPKRVPLESSFASYAQQHQNVDTTPKSFVSLSPERSFVQPSNGFETYSDAVEMQKVYIDVATNLERAFSQKECSARDANAGDNSATTTKLFQDCSKVTSSPAQKNETSIWLQDPGEHPMEVRSSKEYVSSLNRSFSRELPSQNDTLLVGIQKDFARAAATLERNGPESAAEISSVRESLELQNSSTLLSTRQSVPEERSSRNTINLNESERFTIEDVPEFQGDFSGKYSARSSPTKQDAEPEQPQHCKKEEQADDTFITSSSYWRVEPEALNAEVGQRDETSEKQQPRSQECSYVNEALYEKGNFTAERPLKRKKETLEVVRNAAGYESEFEMHESADFPFLMDNGHPAISETIFIAEDCFEPVPTRQFPTFVNVPAPIELDFDESKEAYKSKVEELQIALLECAAEYEVKMVEMEMKMLQMKSKCQGLEQELPQSTGKSEKEWTTKRLENYRKQNLKLQREKEIMSRDMVELRKKERQLDLLRKNLEDSLQKVNSLQRELVKKEEELVDSQLKEKEARAHVYQVEAALQQAEASQIDQGCVVSLVMALSQWLQNVKKQAGLVKFDPRHQLQIQQYEDSLAKLLDEYTPPKAIQNLMTRSNPSHEIQNAGGDFKGNFYLEDAPVAIPPSPPPPPPPQQDCSSVSPLRDNKRDKEVQALQNELEKLACRRATF